MADAPQPVNVQSRRVDSSILPNTFSQPYRLYIIQQNTDVLTIANAANNAGELAYEATVKIFLLQQPGVVRTWLINVREPNQLALMEVVE